MSMSIASEGGLVPIPHPQPVRDQTVFQYTNAQGLIGIIGGHKLWASSTLALNDLSEVKYGIEVVTEAAAGRGGRASVTLQRMLEREDFAGVTRESYVVSASSDGDSISQWVAYAGALGYAIEFDTHHDLDRVDGFRPEDARVVTLPVTDSLAYGAAWWYHIVYEREEQLKIVRAILDVLDEHGFSMDTHLFVPISLCITTFKHKSFANEREVRFIARTNPQARDHFRPGRYGIIPYAEIVSTEPEEKRLPIRSVVIGPLNQDERPYAEATVRSLLDANGYPEVSVGFSSAPYRY